MNPSLLREDFKSIYTLLSLQTGSYIDTNPQHFINRLWKVIQELKIENNGELEVFVDSKKNVFGITQYEVFGLKVYFDEGKVISCIDEKIGLFNINIHKIYPSIALLLDTCRIPYQYKTGSDEVFLV